MRFVYRCSVIGDAKIFKVVSITVEAKPFFSKNDHRPMDVTKAPGGSVTIRCHPSGEPEPVIKWKVNGEDATGMH